MTTAEITAALDVIRQETDLNAKALLLAGLVSELFRERGFEPVVVGGSATPGKVRYYPIRILFS